MQVTLDIDHHGYSMLLDDVGNRVPCAAETTHRSSLEWRRVKKRSPKLSSCIFLWIIWVKGNTWSHTCITIYVLDIDFIFFLYNVHNLFTSFTSFRVSSLYAWTTLSTLLKKNNKHTTFVDESSYSQPYLVWDWGVTIVVFV